MSDEKVPTQHGDFIDREHPLPYDPRPQYPSDVAGDSSRLVAAGRTPAGEPPIDYDVRSIFDSRPVQGYDFNICAATGQEQAANNTFTMTVPVGYVAILRGIIHNMTNPGINNLSDIKLSMKLNGADVPYNKNIPVGFETDGTFPKFFIVADERSIISASFDSADGAGTSIMFCTFYGNFLLKTGRPAIFEVANPAGKGSVRGTTFLPVEMSDTTIAPPVTIETSIPTRATPSTPSTPTRYYTLREWVAMGRPRELARFVRG